MWIRRDMGYTFYFKYLLQQSLFSDQIKLVNNNKTVNCRLPINIILNKTEMDDDKNV